MKFIIPQHAKSSAREALRFNKTNRSKSVGLSEKEAKILGLNSGIARANQILNNKYIDLFDAKRVVAFYNRFKNCKTVRCEQAINLWGGRKWALELQREIKSLNK